MSNAPKEMTYEEIAIGDHASFTVIVTEELVDTFAKMSGDMNPLHMDETYARTTPFGQRIAHGMIAGSLFSRLVGMYLPGRYAVYLSQMLRFHEPITMGMEVEIRGEVTHKTDSAKTITVRTIAEETKKKTLLVSGEAMIKLLK
jgi:3-hydroxybutyryl-CoA dehydratase